MKKIFAVILSLVMAVSLFVPAFAETEAAEVTDENEILLGTEDEEYTYDDWAYEYESDPVGVENGSVIEFNKENYVVDKADIFTDEEEAQLFTAITEIRDTYSFDLVYLTVSDMGSYGSDGAQAYAEDFYDFGGYGYGTNRDGLIMFLYISGVEGSNKVWISGRGLGETVFNSDYVLDFDYGPVFEEVTPILKEGNYGEAAITVSGFVSQYLSDYTNDGYIHGTLFDDDEYIPGASHYSWTYYARKEGIALVFAVIVAFIIVTIGKRKMKTNRIKKEAANYEKPGSMNVTYAAEYFTHSTVSKTARPKSNNSSSGGGGGSSGASHSGGGGSF